MLPPPLLSRIKIFSLPIPSNEDRIKTIEVKIIPKLLKEFNFAEDDIKFTYDAIDMIIRDIREEGLRKTINLTKEIIRKLCTYKYLGKEYSKQIFDIDIDIKFPLIVDIKLLRKIHKMTDKRETYLDMFI